MSSSPTGNRSPRRFNPPHGGLTIITGPMYASKSTELIRLADRYSRAKLSTIIILPQMDTRYTDRNEIITHSGIKYPAIKCKGLHELCDQIEKYDVILVDEAQFITNLDLADTWANNGKTVVLAGLTLDFSRKPFGNLYSILPFADQITTLTAVCEDCGRDAPFSAKKTASTDVIDVGGKDKYKSLCRSCHVLHMME